MSACILCRLPEAPVRMTNIYPFPVGQAAIFHECIDRFPDAEEPENHALSVHCSYAGFAPRMICRRKWKAMPKVLAIVNEKATMVDCELPVSDMVLAKINPPFDKITVIPGEIEKFVQFPDTDFLNATLLHDQKGEKGVEELPFHHRMIIVRKQKAKIVQIAKDFG